FSAYDDLGQESKIGSSAGQLATGNHGHSEFLRNTGANTLNGYLRVVMDGTGNNALDVDHANGAAGEIAAFRTNGTWMALFNQDGDVQIKGTLTENSDARRKKDVETLTGVLPKLDGIRGVAYRFKDKASGPDGRHVGLLAQEVRNAFPELVHEDEDGNLSVAYGKLSAVLLQAIKEQQNTIGSQESEIERLKADLEKTREDLRERLAKLEKLLD
ncbi:MAG: tail fiber domain-containing protein, partial [Planctomycetota bacterium]